MSSHHTPQSITRFRYILTVIDPYYKTLAQFLARRSFSVGGSNYSFSLLILFSLFLLLYHLNSTYLTNWDEAWYAAIARDMATSHDFITPTYNGRVWFAASPLYLWLLAFWFQLTHFNVAGVRLISTFFTLGSVVLTYLIGLRLTNRRTGLIAGFILITSIGFLYRARTGNLDTPLTFFHLLAVFSWLQGRHHPRWYWGIGLASALGFLTKNIFGLLPLSLLLLTPFSAAIPTLLIFFLAVLPWPLLAYSRHGMAFVRSHLLQYAFSKMSNSDPTPGAGFWWYFLQLKPGLKLWVLFLPIAFTLPLVQFVRNSSIIRINSILIRTIRKLFPYLWLLLPLIALSFTALKNNWYLIPFYPAAAIVIALFWDHLIKLEIIKYWQQLVIGLIVAIGLFNISLYWHQFVVPETVAAEARLSSLAGQLAPPSNPIMLDDAYQPIAVFYSNHRVYPLRYSRAYESLVGDPELSVATASGARLVLTNQQNLDQLLTAFHHPQYMTLQTADDKLLIRLSFPNDSNQ